MVIIESSSHPQRQQYGREHEVSSFRQACTPKHCNTSSHGISGGNRYVPVPRSQNYSSNLLPPQIPFHQNHPRDSTYPSGSIHVQTQGIYNHTHNLKNYQDTEQRSRSGSTSSVTMSPGTNSYTGIVRNGYRVRSNHSFQGLVHHNNNGQSAPGGAYTQAPQNRAHEIHGDYDQYASYRNDNTSLNRNGYNQQHMSGGYHSTHDAQQRYDVDGKCNGGSQRDSRMFNENRNTSGGSYLNSEEQTGSMNQYHSNVNSNSYGQYQTHQTHQTQINGSQMNQSCHGDNKSQQLAPNTCNRNSLPHQLSTEGIPGVVTNPSTASTVENGDFDRTVSNSVGESVKSKVSKVVIKASPDQHDCTQVSKTDKDVSPNQDSNYCNSKLGNGDHVLTPSHTRSDNSQRQLNQHSIVNDEDVINNKQIGKNIENVTTPAEKGITLMHPTSDTSSLSNSPSSTLKLNQTNQFSNKKDSSMLPTPSKLTSLDSLSSVASIQEPIDLSHSKHNCSANNFELPGGNVLLNCDSSSASLLFQPNQESSKKRPREEREDRIIECRGVGSDEVRRSPSISPDNRQNNKKMRHNNKFSSNYNGEEVTQQKSAESIMSKSIKTNIDNFSNQQQKITSKKGLQNHENSEGFTSPLSSNGGKVKDYIRDGITYSMPSWEANGQDSFSDNGGHLLSSSFSFNNDQLSIEQNSNNGCQHSLGHRCIKLDSQAPIQHISSQLKNSNITSYPPQFLDGPMNTNAVRIESQNHSFDAPRNQSFDESFHTESIGRSDSYGKSPQCTMPSHRTGPINVPNLHKTCSNASTNYSLHKPSWESAHSVQPGSIGHPRQPYNHDHLHPSYPRTHGNTQSNGPYQSNQPGFVTMAHPKGPDRNNQVNYHGSGMVRNYSQDNGRPVPSDSNFCHPPPGSFEPRRPDHFCSTHPPDSFRQSPDFGYNQNHNIRGPPSTDHVTSLSSGVEPIIHTRHHPSHPSQVRNKTRLNDHIWSKDEDIRLADIMKRYKNPKNWVPIAKELGRQKT